MSALPPCSAVGCANEADPRWTVRGPTGAIFPACDGCGDLSDTVHAIKQSAKTWAEYRAALEPRDERRERLVAAVRLCEANCKCFNESIDEWRAATNASYVALRAAQEQHDAAVKREQLAISMRDIEVKKREAALAELGRHIIAQEKP